MPAFELSQICGDATSSVDIVFVHGLTGHAMRTWGQNDDSPVRPAIWPAALCDASARVWLAGYPSPLLDVFHGGKLGQLFMEEGKEALRCLQEHKLGEKPILFVAHSLGGLLVKALLCKSETERKDDQTAGRPSIVDATAGVVFLATPHAGSDRVAV